MPAKTAKISATIEIAAAPEQVWAVLADLASYPEWNPVFREASGQVAVGSAPPRPASPILPVG